MEERETKEARPAWGWSRNKALEGSAPFAALSHPHPSRSDWPHVPRLHLHLTLPSFRSAIPVRPAGNNVIQLDARHASSFDAAVSLSRRSQISHYIHNLSPVSSRGRLGECSHLRSSHGVPLNRCLHHPCTYNPVAGRHPRRCRFILSDYVPS